MQTSWKGEDSQSLSDSHNIACNFHMIQLWLGNVVAFLCSTAMALVFLELIFQKDHQILVDLVTIIIQHAWSKGAAWSFSSPPDVPVPHCWNQFFRNVCWLHQCVLSLTQPQRPVDTHRDERGLEDVRSLVRMGSTALLRFLLVPVPAMLPPVLSAQAQHCYVHRSEQRGGKDWKMFTLTRDTHCVSLHSN